MPFGSFINVFPPAVFVVIHLALFVVGAYLAYRSYGAGRAAFGRAFSLYAVAELLYLTYHLDWTVILFAHTVAEVLDALAFVLLFVAGARSAVRSGAGGARPAVHGGA